MSSEKRLLRPYVGLDAFQDILDEFRLVVGGLKADALQPRLSLPATSFLHDPTVLLLAGSQDAAEEALRRATGAAEELEIPPSDVELVVLASTPYLRLVDIVHRCPLDDLEALPQKITMVGDDEGVRALRAPIGGCDIEAFFVLRRSQPAKPLRPRRKGTWLGRIRFTLRTEMGELGFTPRFLTAAIREEHGLPDDAIRFVDVNVDALMEGDIHEAVELYVDEELLTQLNQSTNTPGARAFQRQLFLDAIGAMVRAARMTPFADVELVELEGTVLGRLVDAAARGPAGESDAQRVARREHALVLLKEEPEVFISRLEAAARPRDDLRTVIAGGEE